MARIALTASGVALLSLLAAEGADGALPQDERQALIDFYHATNGDDWYRNDGWLDPEIDACDWYGVSCENWFDEDRHFIQTLQLPDNNLSGELPGSILFETVWGDIDLSSNRIGGSLERFPLTPGEVDLSNNRLSGPLPVEHSDSEPNDEGDQPDRIWRLDLSGNDFTGEVPETWPTLNWLDLSNNELEGLPLALFEPHSSSLHSSYINLADNQFAGELPTSIMNDDSVSDFTNRWGGSVNLCWNDFEIHDSELAEWLGKRHVGGANFDQCLGRERTEIDAGFSGSWYDPARSGEGIALQQLSEDFALMYWFTYDDEGNQRWLFETGSIDGPSIKWKQLYETRGEFGQGFVDEPGESVEMRGFFRLDRTGSRQAQAERVYIDPLHHVCVSIYPPPLACFGSGISDRLEYHQLTRLAGTTCDNRSRFQHFSGAWYSPERKGEGFIVEILSGDRVIVYWFTYRSDGSGRQVWMMGDGPIFEKSATPAPSPVASQASVHFDHMVQPQGAQFGNDFDPAAVERRHWGELTIHFRGENHARVEFDSLFEEFGSGEYPIERLTRPMLAECED